MATIAAAVPPLYLFSLLSLRHMGRSSPPSGLEAATSWISEAWLSLLMPGAGSWGDIRACGVGQVGDSERVTGTTGLISLMLGCACCQAWTRHITGPLPC